MPTDPTERNLLRAAFRDLHGARLHGFALLISLGDRPRAASAAATVLAEGTARADELRHPERAAAWLRSRVVDTLRRTPDRRGRSPAGRRAALIELGAPDASVAALEGMSLEDRVALVAGSVERFSLADVAVILGRDSSAARRILRAARQRYLTVAGRATESLPAGAIPGGEIAERLDRAAARAMGRPESGPPA